MAGISAKLKRSAANNSGGSSPRANLMTTKLVPQMLTTANARRTWERGSAACIALLVKGGVKNRNAPNARLAETHWFNSD